MPVSSSIRFSPSSNDMDREGHPQSLLILGAGGHGLVVAELARACGFSDIAFADDRTPDAEGNLANLPSLALRYDAVAVSIGNLPFRQSLLDKLEALSAPVPALVHPTAYVSLSARIALGALVLPGAIVHANAVVGRGAIVSAGAVIDHDAIIGPCSHVEAGAVVAARAFVPPLQTISAGTSILPSANPKDSLP